MKTTKTIEVECCDICKSESLTAVCDSCGKVLCWDHRDTHGVEYPHAVNFSGSGDGFYCKECDAKLLKSGKDKKYNAYRAITALRDEYNAWRIAFNERKDAAEAYLRSLSK